MQLDLKDLTLLAATALLNVVGQLITMRGMTTVAVGTFEVDRHATAMAGH